MRLLFKAEDISIKEVYHHVSAVHIRCRTGLCETQYLPRLDIPGFGIHCTLSSLFKRYTQTINVRTASFCEAETVLTIE